MKPCSSTSRVTLFDDDSLSDEQLIQSPALARAARGSRAAASESTDAVRPNPGSSQHVYRRYRNQRRLMRLKYVFCQLNLVTSMHMTYQSRLRPDSALYIAAKSADCIDSKGCGNLPDSARQHQIYRHMHPQPSLVNPTKLLRGKDCAAL